MLLVSLGSSFANNFLVQVIPPSMSGRVRDWIHLFSRYLSPLLHARYSTLNTGEITKHNDISALHLADYPHGKVVQKRCNTLFKKHKNLKIMQRYHTWIPSLTYCLVPINLFFNVCSFSTFPIFV